MRCAAISHERMAILLNEIHPTVKSERPRERGWIVRPRENEPAVGMGKWWNLELLETDGKLSGTSGTVSKVLVAVFTSCQNINHITFASIYRLWTDF